MSGRADGKPRRGRRPLDAGALKSIERALSETISRNELDRRADGMLTAAEYLWALSRYVWRAGDDASDIDDVVFDLLQAVRHNRSVGAQH